MSLVQTSAVLEHARSSSYVVPAFNVDSFDLLVAVIAAAGDARAPIIVQATEPALRFLGPENVVAVAAHESASARVPVGLHVDHADSLAAIEEALAAGFSSAMIDGSGLPWEKNVTVTKAAVKLAAVHKASIEGAVGHVGTMAGCPVEKVATEDDEVTTADPDRKTTPEEAERFVAETGVAFLAVSVGSSHGGRAKTRRLDLELLAAIGKRVRLPLVIHGTSGVQDQDLASARLHGVAKANVETALRAAFRSALDEETRRDPLNIKPRVILGAVRNAVRRAALERIVALGAAEKGLEWPEDGRHTQAM